MSPSTRSSGHRTASNFGGAPSPSVLGYERLLQQFLTDSAHDSGSASNVFSVLPQFGDGGGPGAYSAGYATRRRLDRRHQPLPGRRPPVRLARRVDHVRDRPRARAGGGSGHPGPRPGRAGAGQCLDRLPAARRRHLPRARILRLELVRRLPLGLRPGPRHDDLRQHSRSADRIDGPAGRRSSGQPRCGGRRRRHRARARRGDHRPARGRLDGSERQRGRGQMRERARSRGATRLRARRLPLQPAHQRPPVSRADDVVERAVGLRAALERDGLRAAPGTGATDAVLLRRERQTSDGERRCGRPGRARARRHGGGPRDHAKPGRRHLGPRGAQIPLAWLAPRGRGRP